MSAYYSQGVVVYGIPCLHGSIAIIYAVHMNSCHSMAIFMLGGMMPL